MKIYRKLTVLGAKEDEMLKKDNDKISSNLFLARQKRAKLKNIFKYIHMQTRSSLYYR